MRRSLVGTLFVIGAFVRLYGLDRYPLPVQQDELSNIYDARSLIETGADRAGTRLPVVVRGFGENDYRPALMAYIIAAPVAVFGMSTESGRLAAGLLSTATLLLIFLLARGVAGEGFAAAALAFAVFSPWLIFDGRIAHEGASLAPFFAILILWLWYRAAAREYTLGSVALLGVIVGLSSSAYQATKLVGPLLLVVIALDILRVQRRVGRAVAVLLITALAGAAPQVWVLLSDPAHFFSRAATTVSPEWKTRNPIAVLITSVAANFSPRYLFWPNMREVFLTTARLLPVEVVFFPLGLLLMWRMKDWAMPRFRIYLYVALLIAVLPAAVTYPNPHSLRAAASAVVIPFFSAAGVMSIYSWLRTRRRVQAAFAALTAMGIVASFCFIGYLYLFSPNLKDERMQNALVKAAIGVRPHLRDHQRVLISTDSVVMPYIYFVAFTGMTPKEYQAAPKDVRSARGWDDVRRVGRFFFRSEIELHRSATVPSPGDLFVTRQQLPRSRVLARIERGWDRYYISDFPRP